MTMPAAWRDAIIPADGPEVVRTYYAPATQHAGLLHEITLEPGGTPDPHLKRTFAYDTHGFLDTIEDARGNVTDLSRDLLGRLTAIENAEEEVVELSYSAPTAGLPDPAAAPPGFFLSEIEIGRTVAEGEGQVRRLRWDARGRLLAFERKDDADTFSTFATFSYDSDGNRTGSTDATGRTVSLDYDLLGQLRLVTDDAGSDPDSCQATPSITS